MRMMKKVMTGMSIAAAALAIVGGANAVKADAAVGVSVTEDGVMKVTGATDEVRVSYDAIKVKGSAETWNAKAKWDVYDGTSADIDLSTLKVSSKDAYVTVADGSDAIPQVYKFTKDASKLKGKYEVKKQSDDAFKAQITFSDNKTAYTSLPALQYRTLTASEWSEQPASASSGAIVFGTDDWTKYQKQGATLYFRYAPEAITFSTSGSAIKVDDETVATMYAQNGGRFAGAEVKVKVAKEGNAPSATIDYDNGVIKLKKGTDYRLAAGSPDWKSTGNDAKDIPLSVSQGALGAGVVEIRTAANEKKVASKIGVYTYKGTDKPNDNEFVNGYRAEALKNASGAAIANAVTGPSVSGGGLRIIYENKKTKTNAVTGSAVDQIKFENTTSKDGGKNYLVFTEDPFAKVGVKPIATVSASKSVTVATSKIEGFDKGDVQLYITYPSDKKKLVFRSAANTSVTLNASKAVQ